MKRRLYFLLPDQEHARAVVEELEQAGIERRYIHAIAGQGGEAGDLAAATPQQLRDTGAHLEKALWYGNLEVFFLALLALIFMVLVQTAWSWLLLPAGIMITTFLSGFGYTSRVPNVHLDEFRDAMRHAEILLMVDVPVMRVAAVERMVHRHHPEATVSGVGWSTAQLPM